MSPRIRIHALIRRQGKLEADAVRAQQRLLATLRRDILAELASATGYRRFQLQQLLLAVTSFTDAGKLAAEAAIVDQVGQAWALGVELFHAGVATAATPNLAGISHPLLRAVLDVTRDQVRSVWSELGSRLKSAIRRAVLGVDDPFKAMQRVALLIRDPKSFGSAEVRAETIVRTEVNRTFSLASAKTAEGAGRPYVKWWVSAEDGRVRPDHAEAADKYNRDGAIPRDEPFIVGGEPLMQPLDPQGSAEQTINCRCVALYREAA